MSSSEPPGHEAYSSGHNSHSLKSSSAYVFSAQKLHAPSSFSISPITQYRRFISISKFATLDPPLLGARVSFWLVPGDPVKIRRLQVSSPLCATELTGPEMVRPDEA
jgi:hypothetical protein